MWPSISITSPALKLGFKEIITPLDRAPECEVPRIVANLTAGEKTKPIREFFKQENERA